MIRNESDILNAGMSKLPKVASRPAVTGEGRGGEGGRDGGREGGREGGEGGRDGGEG